LTVSSADGFDGEHSMAGKLKPLEVARMVTPGKFPDGDGLYLVVAGSTSRNWSYRYWIAGKERWHGLGSLQDVSLKDARLKRDAARQEVRAGVDIVQAKRMARDEAKAVSVATAAPTFEQCAERYIEENWTKWSEKHRAQWPSSLKRYSYPTIRIGESGAVLRWRAFLQKRRVDLLNMDATVLHGLESARGPLPLWRGLHSQSWAAPSSWLQQRLPQL
jgi:Arm DNA-binding domain